MTQARYFDLCEQMNKEPIESEIPVDFDELPYEAQIAMLIYNKLGDRIADNIGFIGKDYTSLAILFEIHGITDTKEIVLEIIHWLENRQIKQSADHMKKEHDKIKRKHSGPKRSYP